MPSEHGHEGGEGISTEWSLMSAGDSSCRSSEAEAGLVEDLQELVVAGARRDDERSGVRPDR